MVQNFAHAWHPMVTRMEPVPGPNGAQQRRFWVLGGDRPYLEQLTYLSHSDRIMEYTALEGIEGARRYQARLQVQGHEIVWSAQIEAAPQRAIEIAESTRAIFRAGLDALANPEPAPQTSPDLPEPVAVQSLRLDGDPPLAISVAPAGQAQTKTLCVFLHGIGGQRGNWQAQMRAMGTIMPCVALDLRGYGKSALGVGQSRVDDYCDDILRVAEYFQAQEIVLCGLSYGAWIATSFAMRHGRRLAGLVLAGGCTGMSEASSEARAAFRHSREVPLDAGQSPADFAADVVQVIAGPDAPDAVRAELRESMAAISSKTYRDALNCFTNPPETFDFARISVPVLLMTGAHDRLASPQEIRQVSVRMHAAAQDPDIRFEVVPDAGHVCNLEQPGAFNAHLAAFLHRFPHE